MTHQDRQFQGQQFAGQWQQETHADSSRTDGEFDSLIQGTLAEDGLDTYI